MSFNRQISMQNQIFSQARAVIKCKNPETQRAYAEKFQKYGGTILKHLSNSKVSYFILDDSPDNVVLRKQIIDYQKNRHRYLLVKIVSHRWIDNCITNRSVMEDPALTGYIHLLPLDFYVPFPSFSNLVIYLD